MTDRRTAAMTAAQHRETAVRWLDVADNPGKHESAVAEQVALARAQLHATLAITAGAEPAEPLTLTTEGES